MEKNRRQEDDEEEEDEEDDLMRLVRRQREAFSARNAAGRPSIRRATANTPEARSRPLASAPQTPVSINPATLSKSERLYRTLVKKYVGKAARTRATVRRDKILMAKRAARDCAKAVRQRQAQKPSKDATCKCLAQWFFATTCNPVITLLFTP